MLESDINVAVADIKWRYRVDLAEYVVLGRKDELSSLAWRAVDAYYCGAIERERIARSAKTLAQNVSRLAEIAGDRESWIRRAAASRWNATSFRGASTIPDLLATYGRAVAYEEAMDAAMGAFKSRRVELSQAEAAAEAGPVAEVSG